MTSNGALSRLATASARRPVVTLAAWVLALGVAGALALGGVGGDTLFQRLKSEAPTAAGQASEGSDILAGDGRATESLTLVAHGIDPQDATAAEATAALAQRAADLPDTELVDPLAVPRLPDGTVVPALAPLIADDGDGFLVTGTVSGRDGGDPDPATVDDLLAELTTTADALRADFPGATVEVGGGTLLVDSIVHMSEQDLQRGETVALPIALLVMLLVFGGFIAAGIPLVGAIAAILGGLGALFGFTFLTDIDTTVINVVTAVGLGLSIDYGLLMVSRFREEYRSGGGKVAAIGRTADKAGRTILYSGLTFAVASLGLLAFEPRLMRVVALGALSVTAFAIVSALTLVPALLSLSGERLVRPGALTRIPGIGRVISRFGDVAPAEGVFSRLTRRVQRHPALVTLATAAVLLLVGSPLLGLRVANSSIDALPVSSTQYDFVETLNDNFSEAASPRVALVTETEQDARTWSATVADVPGVESLGEPRELGDGWRTVVHVDPADGVRVVGDIRAEQPDFPSWVTGADARTVDLTDSLLGGVPLAALIVCLGTVILLFLMTGSLIVPLKALLASALSLGASIGVLVWGFEQGNFAGLMGFDASKIHGVDVLVLVLTFAFGFGLAMDYEMFILSRIKEALDSGVPSREAIAQGLQRSGRIITSAGLIIVVVFAGFATGDLMVIKQLGVALAVAVLLDMTLVRMLLVPALMTWQERVMWWAPRWMKRLHARFGLREG